MEDYRKIAIELGRTLISKAPETRKDVERMLPELKESEDERIRKALKQYFVNSFQNNGVAAICGVHIKDILAWLEKQGKQKPQRIISAEAKEAMYDKPAWSEEDEKFFKTALWHISYSISNGKSTDFHCDTTEWLKSLKDRVQPQNTWKPNDDQISVLEFIMEDIEKDSIRYAILNSVLEQLKKLRKE